VPPISFRGATKCWPWKASPPRSDFRRAPFGRLWYETPDNAIGYAMHNSRSHDAVIRVYDAAGNVIETHEHKGDFKEP